MKGEVIYIAGKMRGLPCYNFKNFFYYQVEFERSGYTVINPAEMDCLRWLAGEYIGDDDYECLLDLDCKIIREEVDILFVLKGWETSEGAKREIEEAEKKGILVAYEDKEVRGSNPRRKNG